MEQLEGKFVTRNMFPVNSGLTMLTSTFISKLSENDHYIKHNGTSELLIIHFGIIAQSTAVFVHTLYTIHTHALTCPHIH